MNECDTLNMLPVYYRIFGIHQRGVANPRNKEGTRYDTTRRLT